MIIIKKLLETDLFSYNDIDNLEKRLYDGFLLPMADRSVKICFRRDDDAHEFLKHYPLCAVFDEKIKIEKMFKELIDYCEKNGLWPKLGKSLYNRTPYMAFTDVEHFNDFVTHWKLKGVVTRHDTVLNEIS